LQQSLPECLKAAISREICIIIIVHHHFYTCLSLSLSFAVLCFVAIRSLIGLVFFQGSETAGASKSCDADIISTPALAADAGPFWPAFNDVLYRPN
jgi:hypothetical protein